MTISIGDGEVGFNLKAGERERTNKRARAIAFIRDHIFCVTGLSNAKCLPSILFLGHAIAVIAERKSSRAQKEGNGHVRLPF